MTHDDQEDEYTARDFLDALRAGTGDWLARLAQTEKLLELLARTNKIRSHRRLIYRCARNCALLEVFQFPEPLGWVFRQPRWKMSPTANESSSNAAGRRSHTLDGNRRWQQNIILPEQCENLILHCDHLHNVLIDKARILADAGCKATDLTLTQSDDTTVIATM